MLRGASSCPLLHGQPAGRFGCPSRRTSSTRLLPDLHGPWSRVPASYRVAPLAPVPMVRFQRQPPGTALTRAALLSGAGLAAGAGWLVVLRQLPRAGPPPGAAAPLLLCGGHRPNHGAGGPVRRKLTELLDR